MMMTRVEALWTELLKQHDRPVFTRVDETHALDLYIGIDTDDSRVLMLLCDQKPADAPTYEVIEILTHHRTDGKWVMLIRLVKQELVVPFSRLCQDLVDSSRAGSGALSAGDFLLLRLARWHRMLQMDRSGLSDAEAKGLIGELLFLQRYAIPSFGIPTSVIGWVGAEGAAQDFRISGRLIEIKTCQVGAERIIISGVDQLDADGLLYLVVFIVSPSVPDATDTLTLCQLVTGIRGLVEIDPGAASEFELRLVHARFDDSDRAAAVPYKIDDVRAYQVRPSFPRITRAETPAGVLDVKYALDLRACSEFQCDLEEICHVDI
jgi:hypothetical protein